MGTKRIELDATGKTVAYNIRLFRKRGGMTLDELSARASEAGRPMSKTTLSQIETENRRVDVDDLMALACALGVNPNALLLPLQRGSSYEMNLTAFGWKQAKAVLAWANGVTPLDNPESNMDEEEYEQYAALQALGYAANYYPKPYDTDVPNIRGLNGFDREATDKDA